MSIKLAEIFTTPFLSVEANVVSAFANISSFFDELPSGILLAVLSIMLALLSITSILYWRSSRRAAYLLQNHEAALRATEARYERNSRLLELTLDHMYQGLVVVGPDGNVMIHNRRAEQYSGVSHDQFQFPAPAQQIFREQWKTGEFGRDGELLPDEVRRFFLMGQGDMPRSYVRRRPNGTVLEVRSEPLPGGGMVQSYTDITELVRAKEAAEAGAKAKSIFLATMSHEIRTPLNGILGMASVLREDRLTPQQRRKVDAITSCGDALLAIINDILDLSKLEAGMMEIESAPFDLPRLIESAVDVTRGAAANKGIPIEVYVDPDLPRIVRGDGNRLRQAMLNLLSNAVKFTEAGKVVLRARRGAPAGQLRIEVADTGIGVPEEAHDRLFKEFSQVDASISRRFGGTGLGLAITQRIVKAMSGQIGFDSAPGKGSCFWFEIPIVAAPDAVLPEPSAMETRSLPVPVSAIAIDGDSVPAAALPGTGWRILVAEDMAVNQMVARGLLEARGHSVEVAADGWEAISKAEAHDYDLILMDMQMPRMDGLEATRAIRARGGKLAAVPIVAMTANAFGSDQAACLEAGMSDFVSKPIDAEKLYEALDRAMSGGRGRVMEEVEEKKALDEDVAFDRAPLATLLRQLGVATAEDIIQSFRAELQRFCGRLDTDRGANATSGDLGRELRSLQIALSNLGVVAAANYCRAQLERIEAGEELDADLLKVMDRLVGAGLRMCDRFIVKARFDRAA